MLYTSHQQSAFRCKPYFIRANGEFWRLLIFAKNMLYPPCISLFTEKLYAKSLAGLEAVAIYRRPHCREVLLGSLSRSAGEGGG